MKVLLNESSFVVIIIIIIIIIIIMYSNQTFTILKGFYKKIV